jgi:hypothetical protein
MPSGVVGGVLYTISFTVPHVKNRENEPATLQDLAQSTDWDISHPRLHVQPLQNVAELHLAETTCLLFDSVIQLIFQEICVYFPCQILIEKERSYQSIVYNATPNIQRPAVLYFFLPHPMRVHRRPIMHIVPVYMAVTFK